MATEWHFRAVEIETPLNEPNRLYCDQQHAPRLWLDSNAGDPADVAKMLIANGLKASPVRVRVIVDEQRGVR